MCVFVNPHAPCRCLMETATSEQSPQVPEQQRKRPDADKKASIMEALQRGATIKEVSDQYPDVSKSTLYWWASRGKRRCYCPGSSSSSPSAGNHHPKKASSSSHEVATTAAASSPVTSSSSSSSTAAGGGQAPAMPWERTST